MTPINKNYPYLLWIYSAVIGSIFLFVIYMGIYADALGIAEAFWLVVISAIFAAIFSWLIFLLCYFIFWKLVGKKVAPLRIKSILCCISIAALLLTCAFFGIHFFNFNEDMIIPLSYMLGILLATWILKINKA